MHFSANLSQHNDCLEVRKNREQLTFDISHERVPGAVNPEVEDVGLASLNALNDGLDRLEQERGRGQRRQDLLRHDRSHCRRRRRLFAQKSLRSLLRRRRRRCRLAGGCRTGDRRLKDEPGSAVPALPVVMV